jgi:hypothetical protein
MGGDRSTLNTFPKQQNSMKFGAGRHDRVPGRGVRVCGFIRLFGGLADGCQSAKTSGLTVASLLRVAMRITAKRFSATSFMFH